MKIYSAERVNNNCELNAVNENYLCIFLNNSWDSQLQKKVNSETFSVLKESGKIMLIMFMTLTQYTCDKLCFCLETFKQQDFETHL